MLDSLIKDAMSLSPVPSRSSLEYHIAMETMLEYVNGRLISHSALNSLIGQNSVDVMLDNHKNHVNFMDNVFFLNNFELLARIIPWVYNAYMSHGFSADYFPVALNIWIEAIGKAIEEQYRQPLVDVYNWMLDNHERMLAISEDIKEPLPHHIEMMGDVAEEFLQSLINGDHKKALSIARSMVHDERDIEKLYLSLINPVMVRIGDLWQRNNIGVAQEHLASSIVTRIMASIYSEKTRSPNIKGRVMVTSAPNEFHEIGAWMISDLLEINGWRVQYLGSNTPGNELKEQIKIFMPHVLAISIIMPYNIKTAADIIKDIKSSNGISDIKIMVGGPRFNEIPDLYRIIGADGYASDASKACLLADKWFREINGK